MSIAQAINKQIFLTARQCLTKAWFDHNSAAPVEAPSEADLFRMEQGREIGRLARSLFPEGRYIPGGRNEAAARRTQAAIADPKLIVVFESTFVLGNYVAKPDILLREGDGWRVVVVKSSLADTDQLEELIDDLTYTVMVLKRAVLNVIAAELMLICRDYRKGQATSRLFQRLDKTDVVNQRLPGFNALWDDVERATSGKTQPTPKVISACRSCPHFDGDCLGKGIEHSIFSLPRLHPKRLAQLADDDIIDLRHLPQGFRLTPVWNHALGP